MKPTSLSCEADKEAQHAKKKINLWSLEYTNSFSCNLWIRYRTKPVLTLGGKRQYRVVYLLPFKISDSDVWANEVLTVSKIPMKKMWPGKPMSDVLGFPANKETGTSRKNESEKLSLKRRKMVGINFVQKLWNPLWFKRDTKKRANDRRGAMDVLQPGTVQTVRCQRSLL